jgi:acyl-CoA hydrolase
MLTGAVSLHVHQTRPPSPQEAIGEHAAALVPDGATLQMGTAAIRDAVLTEYGAVNLFGLSLRQRGEVPISIAHPDFRAELRGDLAATRHYVL